jgi:hypothetical protein
MDADDNFKKIIRKNFWTRAIEKFTAKSDVSHDFSIVIPISWKKEEALKYISFLMENAPPGLSCQYKQ